MPTRTSTETSGWNVQQVIDWVFTEGRHLRDSNSFVHQFAQRLDVAGAPVDRLMIGLRILHPQLVATSETWRRDTGTTLHIETVHEIRLSERYIGSPMQYLVETRQPLRRSLVDLPDDAHRAYTELAEQGHTDYFGLPIMIGEEHGATMIVSTCAHGGFREDDIRQFEKLGDYIAPVLEAHGLRQLSRSLLNTYVGKRTGAKVLAGMIRRGDAEVIDAALWFSDLRDFTHLTETLAPDRVLKMLNDYFEFIAAAVTARGGEILRFIGDAMLIVFPIEAREDASAACRAALDAALDARGTLGALNHLRRRHGEPPIEFGVGLNLGKVIYGNVGAPDRLDFTVMGPAVNRTARLESLTKTLGRNILFSREFAERIDQPITALGEHEMKGVAGPQAVFALETEC